MTCPSLTSRSDEIDLVAAQRFIIETIQKKTVSAIQADALKLDRMASVYRTIEGFGVPQAVQVKAMR